MMPTSPLIQRTENLYDLPDALSKLGYQSVFDVVRVPRERFVRQHRNTLGRRAQKMYDLAIGYAHQVGHAFRHSRMTRAVNGALRGPFSISGPNYASQFLDAKTGWKDRAPSGSPEANDGPVAYLAHIFHRALQEEGGAAGGLSNKLSERRPDIGTLFVDDAALNQEIPQIQLVNEVLGSAIQGAQKLSDMNGVNTLLSTARYPNTLPFHHGNQQIRVAASTLGVSLADRLLPQNRDLLQAFWNVNTTLNASQAIDLARLQIMASQLAPEQQKIVTEPAYFGNHQLYLTDIYDEADQDKEWSSDDVGTSLPYTNTNRSGFVLPLQDAVPEYADRPGKLVDGGGGGDHSIMKVTLFNANDETESVQVVLRGRQKTYYLYPMNAAPGINGNPYTHNLLLSYHLDDNANIDLSKTWAGKFEVLFVDEYTNAHHKITISLCLASDNRIRYTSTQAQFYQVNYGDGSLSVDHFGSMEELTSRTGLTVPDVEKMLCATAGGWTSFTVIQSKNYKIPNQIFTNGQSTYPTSIGAALPFIYGAKFIHAGMGNCIFLSKDSSDASLKINGALTDDRMDRINRMVRLQKWTGLPFEELDLLVTATMEAEGDGNLAFQMNDNTLRMLGVFQHYRSTYGVAPKQFAAWLHIVTPFGITPDTPFLDQVFNSNGAFDTPLVVDNQDFVYTLSTGEDSARVKKICSALGLNQRQFLLFADQIARQQGGVSSCTLNCNIFVVSAFYRLASLAKALGLSPEDFSALVDLTDDGTNNVWQQLAGQPAVVVPQNDTSLVSDFLTLLQTLSMAAAWLQKSKLPAAMVQVLAPSGDQTLAAEGNYGGTSSDDVEHLLVGWKNLKYNSQTGDLSLVQLISLRISASADGIWMFQYPIPHGFDLDGKPEWVGDGFADFNKNYGADDSQLTNYPNEGYDYPAPGKTYVIAIPFKASLKDLSTLNNIKSEILVATYASHPKTSLDFFQGMVIPPKLRSTAQGTNDQLSLIQDVWQHLSNTLVDDMLLRHSGAPLVDDNGKALDWWSPLFGDDKLVDTVGLVTDAADATVSVTIGGQPVSIIKLVSDVVDAQTLSDAEKGQAKASLNAAVVRARQTQTGVATSLLAKTLDMSQSLSALVLRWAQLTPYQWLKQTWALKSTVHTPADIPAAYLCGLREIARRALICQHFSLSPAAAQRLLTAPGQFSLPSPYAGDVNLWTLYMLSRYDDLLHQVGGSGQGTENDVLAYLQAVSQDPPPSGPDAAEQLASLLGWEQEEVLAAWQVLSRTAATIPDLDVVLRLQQAERDTGLTVSQQQQAFALSWDSSYDAWQAVGQAMVAGASHLKGDH